MPYLLDANVFIQAKNLHYGFDFCPAFWEWIVQQNASGSVFSIEKVGDEIAAGVDDLAVWASQRGPGFFITPAAATPASLGTVSVWATGAGYEPAAVNTFLQVADYYLVAEGHARGFVVVTHEVPSPSTRRIKIPNACLGVGVKFITPYEMLRIEKARFVLGPPPSPSTPAVTGLR